MKAVSDLLAEGWSGDVTVLRELKLFGGWSDREAAELCLVSPETLRRWGKDRNANPLAVRLLAVAAGYCPWRGWAGWEMHNGCLFPPGYERFGLKPGEIMAMPFVMQLRDSYGRQLEELRAELQALSNRKGRWLALGRRTGPARGRSL